MFPFPKAGSFLNDFPPETASAAQARGYDDVNCGCRYRCGWGCEPLLVADDDGISDDDTIVVGQDAEIESQREESTSGSERGGDVVAEDVDRERSGLIRLVDHDSEYSDSVRFQQEDDVLSEDLEVHPCITRSPSTAPSSDESIEARSPIPGFEVTTAGMPTVQLTAIYYFSQTPLRLSAQDEHCRDEIMPYLFRQD